jgi:hypothetical protein
MTGVTPAQFDGLTIEERDAYLERRDKKERQRAIAASLPIDEVFMRYAADLVRSDHWLVYDLSTLAKRVAEKCRSAGVTNPRGGEPYAPKTVCNYLTQRQNKLRLLDTLLAGVVPGSIESFLHVGSNDDYGTKENAG